MVEKEGNAIRIIREGEVVQLEAYGSDIVRVRAASSEILDISWTLLKPKDAQVKIYKNEDEYVLENGKVIVKVTKEGKISFWNRNQKLLCEEFWREERGIEARVLKGMPGNLFYIEQSMNPAEGEHFYGLGQEAHDLFDLKGAVLDLCQQNTKSTIPFVISSRGYGFIWNNPAVGRVEFGTSRTRWVAERAKQIDYLIVGGDTTAEVEKNYCRITGYAPKFPMWATGLWQSKLRYETQEELIEIAREYKRRGITLSMIVCDYFHWTQQGEWKFDKDFWPNPKEMIKELEGMGIKLLVSIWPTVDPRSENFFTMREKNMLIRSERGPGALVYCRGPETYYDATNPEARKFVWDIVKKNYCNIGVENFWLDEAEPEIIPYDYDNLRYYMGNGMEVSSLYPFYYAKTFYDGLKMKGQKEVVNLIRCAFIGSQRFGIVLWSGDIRADFDSLRRQIKVGLHVAISGIPWWTTDIGGFQGGDPNSEDYRECLIRWFQFGVFCPIFRMHGFRYIENRPVSPPITLEGFCYSGGPNEIWSYGEEAYKILMKYVAIRERMRPYIHKYLLLASEEGTPLMRPLFYDFPEEEFYDIFDQYMFGPDIMVCPIYEKNMRTRKVVLPKRERWIEVESGLERTGGEVINVEAPLHCIPLFLRKGAELNLEMLR